MPKFLKGGPNPGFKKGQSGNPRGRPKAIVDVAAAKVEMFTPEHAAQARATLLAIMNDPKATASARFSAAQFVYERVHGRTAQRMGVLDLAGCAGAAAHRGPRRRAAPAAAAPGDRLSSGDGWAGARQSPSRVTSGAQAGSPA